MDCTNARVTDIFAREFLDIYRGGFMFHEGSAIPFDISILKSRKKGENSIINCGLDAKIPASAWSRLGEWQVVFRGEPQQAPTYLADYLRLCDRMIRLGICQRYLLAMASDEVVTSLRTLSNASQWMLEKVDTSEPVVALGIALRVIQLEKSIERIVSLSYLLRIWNASEQRLLSTTTRRPI